MTQLRNRLPDRSDPECAQRTAPAVLCALSVCVLGMAFVSLSESLDTATPAGRRVFTVLGAVAELERSVIAERVRAGLRNAKAKGKRRGRPGVVVDRARIGRFRAQGHSWAKIADS